MLINLIDDIVAEPPFHYIQFGSKVDASADPRTCRNSGTAVHAAHA